MRDENEEEKYLIIDHFHSLLLNVNGRSCVGVCVDGWLTQHSRLFYSACVCVCVFVLRG